MFRFQFPSAGFTKPVFWLEGPSDSHPVLRVRGAQLRQQIVLQSVERVLQRALAVLRQTPFMVATYVLSAAPLLIPAYSRRARR